MRFALALFCLWGAPAVSLAQVLEIGDDGRVVVYSGPSVFTQGSAAPIVIDRGPVHRRGRPQGHVVAKAAMAPRATPVAVGAAIGDAAVTAQLSPELIKAVAWQESRMSAAAVSRAGAIGEMQLMPDTAKALGVDPHDSRENYRGGATYLRVLMNHYNGDLVRTLAAYNAGPRAVDRYGGIPPYRETQAYVAAVLDRLGQQAANPEARGSGKSR
jgi:soluble lytic murein transglycosylase-like protein